MNARLAGVLTTAALLAIALPLSSTLETTRRVGFCLPATVLAASALGGGWTSDPAGDGYRIRVRPHPIHVASTCSGLRFFCIALALMAGLCVERGHARLTPWMLPAAYLMTVVANAARIVCGRAARIVVDGRLPDSELAFVHMTVGAACFVIFLIMGYGLLERILTHGITKTAAQ